MKGAMMDAGRSSLFDVFYRENYPRIYRYSYRLVGNSEEAEQLTQESFKNLYCIFANGTRITDIKALAYRIAHNVCINFLKKGDKFKNILEHNGYAIPLSVPSVEDEVIAKHRLELLRKAILSLSKRDQRCLFLYWEGFSYREISTITNIRGTSIGRILARAINKLSNECQRGEGL
jgi:RNA polymerase sigma-70 factor, ECF subfamily